MSAMYARENVQSSGSWFGVVTISSFLVLRLYPSQPHPEPWMAAVFSFIFFLNASRKEITPLSRRRVKGDETHTIDATKIGFDGGLEGTRRELSAAVGGWCEVLPEEGVVDMSCASHTLSSHPARNEEMGDETKRESVPPPLNLSAAWRAIFSLGEEALA